MLLTRRDTYSIFIIFFISLLAYFNTFANSFHYDDYSYILNNDAFKEYINHSFSVRETFSNLSNRSTVLATLYLNFSIDGFNVFGFHVVNLIIHILSCLLIFLFVKETLRIIAFTQYNEGNLPSISPSPLYKREGVRINAPLIAGLLFAVHPVNTQAVTYISNRSTLMATCFYLVSFLCFIKGAIAKFYLKIFLLFFLSAVFFVLGFGSKIIIITAPVLFFIYYLCVIPQNSSLIKRAFLDKLPVSILAGIAATPLILILISKYITHQRLTEMSNTLLSKFLGQALMTISLTKDYFSSTIYLLTEFKVIVFYYLKMTIFPFNQNIDPDFPVAGGITDFSALSGLFIIISILIIGLYFYKKNRLITFGIFWVYITLLPTSSIIPLIDTVAEHRMYLPYVGIVIIVSAFSNNFYLKDPLNSKKRVAYSLIFILFPIILFSILTVQRNFIWKDEISLWLDAGKKSPWLRRPFNNLGEAYEKNADYQKAIQALKKAIAISPDYDFAHNNLGTVYGKLNQIDLAIQEYRHVLQINNQFPTVHYNLGKAYEMKGMLHEAVQEYSLAIKQQFNFYQAYFNLADIYSRQGLYQKAISASQKFLKYKPSNPTAHFQLGNIFIKKGNIDEAFQHFSRAAELDNNYLPAKIAIGNILMMKGNFDRAEKIYQQVLKIDPNNFTAYNNLGLMYLRHKKDPSKAVRYFKKSLNINPAQRDAKSIMEMVQKYSQ